VATSGRPKRGLIIGCGIAGPVLAIFLRRAGVEPVIYEGREGGREEAGSFLGLAPNGRDVLSTLGIRERIEGLGIPTPRIAFHNHRGRELAVNPQPIVTIKRGALSKGLREAAVAQGVAVEFDRRLATVEQDAGSVVARFADGSEAEGDFLVGCDGIRSAVRRSITPDAPAPEYTELITDDSYTRVDGLQSTEGTMHMTFCRNGFHGTAEPVSGASVCRARRLSRRRVSSPRVKGSASPKGLSAAWRHLRLHGVPHRHRA
jgi:2-polyprenyl-6-methoxyphenol hydroxylase-like FAD-dependent oxidoreductase